MTAIVSSVRRHPASISLSFGVFLTFLLALPLSFVANWRSQVLQEHRAGRRLRELGGVTDDHGARSDYKLRFALPADCWRPISIYGLRQWSDKDGGSPVDSPINTEVVQLLPQLKNLRVLCLSGARQPDVSLEPLSRRNSPN